MDDGIVFVGWENKPRKHGIVYCSNRRCVHVHPSMPHDGKHSFGTVMLGIFVLNILMILYG